jgi:serine/threonine-protein kinase
VCKTTLGSVYRAEEAHSGAEVELISLKPDASWSQFPRETSNLDRLWDQLSRARGVNHPNIARVKGMGRIPEGARYIALEVLRGELLSEILNTRGALPLDQAVDLTLQAASGLQAAHAAGVLHGNLSPDNILVTRTLDHHPLVKLIRFGLAPHATGPPAGRKRVTKYTAPEWLAGQAGDERSDIYSLGAVLHHLLTGYPPGVAPGEAELIPEAARPVISKALEPLPAHRFGTVAAFGRALAAVRDASSERPERAGGVKRVVAIGASVGTVALAGLWLLPSADRPPLEEVSGRQVTVSGVAPAAQVESMRGRQAQGDTAPAPRSPAAGATTPRPAGAAASPRPDVSPRQSVQAAAGERPKASPLEVRNQSGSAGITPDDFSALGGASAGRGDATRAPAPAGSAPAESVLGYAPGSAGESPAPADETLTRTVAMRLALGDVLRLDIVADYREVRPGLLVLALGSGYRTSTSREYNLRQLYGAYTEVLDHPDEDPVMELWQNGRRIGQYSRKGLQVGPER